MSENKIKSYLGFAIRSGKVVFGYDNLFVTKKQPLLVLISSSQNEKMTDKVFKYSLYDLWYDKSIFCFIILTISELMLYVFSVLDLPTTEKNC